MRKLTSLFFVVAIGMTGALHAVAQDAETSVADGVGSSALWTNDQGHPMATVEVTDVIAGWDEYEDRSAPSRGYSYYAVNLTVTSVGEDEVEVDPRRFSLVDTQGLLSGPANVSQTRDSTANIIGSGFMLAPGAAEEGTLVFELFDDVMPNLFTWEPDNNSIVIIDLSDGAAADTALAYGMVAPATVSDDRGEPVGSIEVLEIDEEWNHHPENQVPERGYRYVAVHFVVTNLSDDTLEMNPNNIYLQDHESAYGNRTNVRADDDAPTPISTDRVELAPDEAFEGMLVFALYDGVEPTAVVWAADNNLLAVVILDDGGDVTDLDATPAGDVVDDSDDLDIDASPAA